MRDMTTSGPGEFPYPLAERSCQLGTDGNDQLPRHAASPEGVALESL